jgi:hypothetical protein
MGTETLEQGELEIERTGDRENLGQGELEAERNGDRCCRPMAGNIVGELYHRL